MGLDADVRFTAFRQRLAGAVAGGLVHVSSDRLQDRVDLPAYYTVRAKVTAEALRRAGHPDLKAGMPADVFVRTRARTVLDYWLEPLTDYLARAMREP